ncbi:MAG TPA: (deoxy)nucleoside triphosphate pyrophosphohydrolase [Polyangia bacterium]
MAAKRRPERRRLLVVAAFIERRGCVLLSQRRADQSFPLAWEFPGGKVEFGEDLVSALVREIREELDCTIRVKEIVDLVYHAYPDFDLIMPVYRATITRGSPRACQVASIEWVPRQRLADMTMPPADVPLAKKLSRIRVRR